MAVSIHGNNGFITTNGTAGAPSLAAPDTDTGFFFDTNTIKATTSGSERLRIDSSGRIGIDYTPGSGDGPFNVDVTGSNNIFHLGHGTNNDNYYTTGASGTQYFRTPSANQLVIKSDGKLGIGNVSPQQLLHVWPDTANTTSAYVRVTAGDRNSNTGIDLGHDASGDGQVNVVSNGTLAFSTNNTARIKIANNSAATSIGGALTFNALLTTQGDVSGGLLMLKAAENTNRFFVTANDTSGCEVNLYDDAGGQKGILGVSSGEFFMKAPNSSAPMNFYTHNGSSIGLRLKINAAGDILLGTDQATIGCNTADGSDNRSFSLCGGSDASQNRGGIITIYGNEANNGSSEYGCLAIRSGNTSTGNIQFWTQGTHRARITSDGFLLLGTTDTGFSSGYTTMTIGNASTTNTGLTIASSPSNGYSRIHFADANSGNAKYAGWIAYSHQHDQLLFSTNNSGSTKLCLNSEGKLGINDSTPNAYLDVYQGGIDSDVPGINIFMNGVGGGTSGDQYGLKITGGGYNNATHIYGIYVDKTQQLSQQSTAAHHKMSGVYSTLYGTQSIVNVTDTGATGTAYGLYASARGNSGSAKNKVGYGIWAESTGTNFQLANAARFKTMSGATLVYGIIYQHGSSEVFRVSSNGDVWSATNSYTSDRDLKDNIVNLSGTSLDKIKQLTPKRFNWKLDDRVKDIEDYDDITVPTNTVTGLIAQEVKPILPDIVSGTDGQKDMGINYNGLVAHLVNAVKELSAENEAMRARLDALESS